MLLALLVACGDDDPASSEPVTIARSDGCGDALFWATSGDDTVGMTVYLDVRDRDPSIEGHFPLDDAEIEVIRGERLSRNQCTDVIDMAAEPTSTHVVKAVRGEIVLPAGPVGCPGDGLLRIEELVADDGTTFEPFEVRATGIGCYSG